MAPGGILDSHENSISYRCAKLFPDKEWAGYELASTSHNGHCSVARLHTRCLDL